jgi:hypothetical protein
MTATTLTVAAPQRVKHVTKNLTEVLKRFGKKRGFLNPRGKKAFNKDTFTLASRAYLIVSKITEQFGTDPASQNVGPPIVNVQNVACFKDVIFMRGNVTGKFISVASTDMRDLMIQRNFSVVLCSHCTDPEQLPDAEVYSPQNKDATNEELVRVSAPTSLTIPTMLDGSCRNGKMPNLWTLNEEETAAASIVRAFEDKVIDGHTKTIYSPYRFWTADIIKKNGMNGDTSFSTRCAVYCYVKEIMAGTSPALISLQVNVLKKAAVKAKNELKFHDKSTTITWLERAVAIANGQ